MQTENAKKRKRVKIMKKYANDMECVLYTFLRFFVPTFQDKVCSVCGSAGCTMELEKCMKIGLCKENKYLAWMKRVWAKNAQKRPQKGV